MKTVTLVLVKSANNACVLLARRKRGEIGRGFLNGTGGKLELKDKGSLKRCASRKALEEWGILLHADKLDKVAELHCYAKEEICFVVHVFVTHFCVGVAGESESNEKPEWYDIDSLPLDELHRADRHWMPYVLNGGRFNVNLFFLHKPGKGFKGLEFTPFESVSD